MVLCVVWFLWYRFGSVTLVVGLCAHWLNLSHVRAAPFSRWHAICLGDAWHYAMTTMQSASILLQKITNERMPS